MEICEHFDVEQPEGDDRMNSYIFLLAGIGAWFLLVQLARLAWHLLDRAALHLYIRRNKYRLEIRDRLEYYV